MKLITLNNGQQTQVSDEDFIFLSGYKWYLHNNGYAYSRIRSKLVSLHGLIAERMNLNYFNDIDHIDRNKLNNQRKNLRAATRSQNNMNSNLRKDNTSGYKGVSWDTKIFKWVARIKVKNKYLFLGYYNTKEAAAFAYKIAAEKYFGEFANASIL